MPYSGLREYGKGMGCSLLINLKVVIYSNSKKEKFVSSRSNFVVCVDVIHFYSLFKDLKIKE